MSRGIVFAPVLHGSLPFAVAVREIFLREKPDCVAVELPDTLGAGLERAVRRLPLISVVRYPVEQEHGYLLVEPCDAIFEALRLAHEYQVPAHCVDRDCDEYEVVHERVPDPYAVHHIGYATYMAEVSAALAAREPSREDEMREATMAYHLSELAGRHDKVLFVCGAAHVARIQARLESATARPLGRRKRDGVQVFHVPDESSREVLTEPGWVQQLFEQWRAAPAATPAPSDRYAMARDLLMLARERMRVRDGERVETRALRVAMQFARNQALLRNGLAPDVYELAIAARGCASDDFAWHVWDLAVSYPYQTDAPDLPVHRLTIDELGHRSRRVIWHRRARARRHDLRLLRARKQQPAERSSSSTPMREPYVCSYPPEDVRIEAYGDYLKKRGKTLLELERARVAPLVAGFGDGLDLRETIRNLPHDGRLHVVERRASPSQVSAVCMVFDAEDREHRYPWRVTWQGEHEGESDMALYATAPEAHLVGPRIARCEYGGFLMTYPPGRMFNVFEDKYFDTAQTPAERLLYAAIDYAIEPSILYVAARPPRAKVSADARKVGKKIMYLPIGQLSPGTLRALRVFHVLEGRAARAYAHHFIGR